MDGINIDDLTIEQYLRLTQEHQTPSMVKKVDDMTIAEYVEYEERIKRQYNIGAFNEEAGYTTDEESVMSEHEAINPVHVVNTQSFKEELSSEEDLDECRVVHKNKNIKVVEADLKNSSEAMEDTVNNDSLTSNFPLLEELNPGSFLLPFIINNYNSYDMANIHVSNNVMRRSIYEYLKPDNLWGATVSVKMDDMTQQETLGTVKNVLVKIHKFEFPCDFVVTDMPENLGEMIILGRQPFMPR
ncbi:reverse transcriptase domain-containing protein [Tanacetum coccineum]|uniref:Reverse transcriptase domain-containing protein n=1 Tax=Tanacetum coccineum TaxID=301880 RepID=A0ABQ5FUM4_9ASTR